MGGLECAGCTFIGFGPIVAMFIFTIARDPLRIILFVAGAFFWLLSLLVSSLWWFAVVPLKTHVEFGLFFAVIFQELFRFLYFILIQKAETGLQKMADSGMNIDGIHSLRNAQHTIAYVCGVGFGFMSGAFALVNVLADATGPGTPGFPEDVGRGFDSDAGHGDYTFFVTSALCTSAFILLNIFWTVIFFHGCRQRLPVLLVGVVVSHLFVSGISLLNKQRLYYVSIPIIYGVTILMGAWAYICAGGSRRNIMRFARHFRLRGRNPLLLQQIDGNVAGEVVGASASPPNASPPAFGGASPTADDGNTSNRQQGGSNSVTTPSAAVRA